MQKGILVIGVVVLFVGLTVLPAEASAISDEPDRKGPGWEYFVIGLIKSYEIVEWNGTEHIDCKAVRVKMIGWNVFEVMPKLPIIMKVRFGEEFCIPYEGAKLIGPTHLGYTFIIARGSL